LAGVYASLDTVAKDKQKLLSRITGNMKTGDIILLHDSMEMTADILPELIEEINRKGFKIVSLDKMLNITHMLRIMLIVCSPGCVADKRPIPPDINRLLMLLTSGNSLRRQTQETKSIHAILCRRRTLACCQIK